MLLSQLNTIQRHCRGALTMSSANLCFEHREDQWVAKGDMGLVAAARAGSEAAFADLHRLYANRLYRTIYSITKNHEDAEDALQETLLRAYLALDAFEGRSQFLSWLTRIAINSALMALRKRSARRETNLEPLSCVEHETLEIQVKDPAPDPEEACLRAERSRCVMHAVTKLQPALREAVQLKVGREYSVKEIAKSLDLSVPAVKSRLHRARRWIAARARSETHQGKGM
jgi:RNA polymerase sigma-70 factor (ECF subfamily)